MEANTRHCARQWRKAGAHVIVVEFSQNKTLPDHSKHTAPKQVDDTPQVHFAFNTDVDVGDDEDRHLCNTLLQFCVKDVMWYKEMGFNLALAHVPSECTLVGLFDNDVLVVPSDELNGNTIHENELPDEWWVKAIHETFQKNPRLSFMQPFDHIALTTENVRNDIIGLHTPVPPLKEGHEDDGGEGGRESEKVEKDCSNPPGVSSLSLEDAVERCERMMRLRKSVMRNPQDGVVGGAWVVRKHVVTKVPLFAHTYMGGGDALMLNLWLGAVSTIPHRLPVHASNELQKYYFHPNSTFARPLQRYRKKLSYNLQLPLHCTYIPCTLLHLYHGELASKRTHAERYQLWKQRRFHAGRDVVASSTHTGIFEWTESFRSSGINTDLQSSLERSHSVREKALLRMAKVHRCMDSLREQIRDVVSVDRTAAVQEATAHQELSNMMRKCLEAFHFQYSTA